MQNVRTIHSSWLSEGIGTSRFMPSERFELGPALLQLVVGEIDNRANSRPGDVIATLAFIVGRIVQRNVFLVKPQSFRLDQSANGIAFLRSDIVSAKLYLMQNGTFASKLVESALLAGANRFPDFVSVRENAHESMVRRGACYLEGHIVSDSPDQLLKLIQSDIDAILIEFQDYQVLTAGIFEACGLAIGYGRHRLDPVLAAELAMGVATYAGWMDQRKLGTRAKTL